MEERTVPTINEVWEQAQQINANLAIIHNDLTALNGCCGTTNGNLTVLNNLVEETNDWLEELRQLVNDGFAATAAGLAGIAARQNITNTLLTFQIQQNQTMICILEQISRNTCELLNHSAQQTSLQKSMAADMAALRHMFATAHPDAALELDRADEVRRRLEKCCPPTREGRPCTYEPCAAPGDVRQETPPHYAGFDGRPTHVKRRRRSDVKG